MSGPLIAKDAIQVFTGNANRGLAESICEKLGVELGHAAVRKFSDGETQVDIQDNVRGGDVFVVQSTSSPGNEHLMELLLLLDALKRASQQTRDRLAESMRQSDLDQYGWRP